MKIKQQIKTICYHNKTIEETTWKAGYYPTRDDVKPLTWCEGDNFQHELMCRFIDMKDGKPLTDFVLI